MVPAKATVTDDVAGAAAPPKTSGPLQTVVGPVRASVPALVLNRARAPPDSANAPVTVVVLPSTGTRRSVLNVTPPAWVIAALPKRKAPNDPPGSANPLPLRTRFSLEVMA